MKIRGTFDDKHKLYATITEDVRLFTKILDPMSMFCSASIQEKSIQSAENFEFRIHQDILAATVNIDHTDPLSKEAMIMQCRYYYRKDKMEQYKIDEFEKTYTSQDALHWYTKDSFAYRLLNKALRTRNTEVIHAFRFFIVDLHQQIRELHWKQMQGKDARVTTLYRGQLLPKDELEELKKQTGKKITMNGFLSTSSSSSIALLYSGEGQQRPFYESVFFQIDLPSSDKHPAMPYCNIAHLSKFKGEHEYLFKFRAIFEVVSVEKPTEEIWYVQLRLERIEDHSLNSTNGTSREILIDFFSESVSNNETLQNINLMVDEISLEHRNRMAGYIKLGDAYEERFEHTQQLRYYRASLEVLEKVSNDKHPLLSLGYDTIIRKLAGVVQDCTKEDINVLKMALSKPDMCAEDIC
ncbi:unnamed protein product [Adineta steineri]|uniref:NAD(P)(+)--arginine ADP-ribosyltransferase n=1 Tax=Adineta steineri TaxID=433720 RepID=A0A815UC81_9BILA|nr:unnamed protein product [Adineta steineri]CAF1648600.1 unnamed protein product [Adineta steineri]